MSIKIMSLLRNKLHPIGHLKIIKGHVFQTRFEENLDSIVFSLSKCLVRLLCRQGEPSQLLVEKTPQTEKDQDNSVIKVFASLLI